MKEITWRIATRSKRTRAAIVTAFASPKELASRTVEHFGGRGLLRSPRYLPASCVSRVWQARGASELTEAPMRVQSPNIQLDLKNRERFGANTCATNVVPPAPNNEMHGTPQGYLSCIVAGRPVTSIVVNRCSTGARDLNAVGRHERSVADATEMLGDRQAKTWNWQERLRQLRTSPGRATGNAPVSTRRAATK